MTEFINFTPDSIEDLKTDSSGLLRIDLIMD